VDVHPLARRLAPRRPIQASLPQASPYGEIDISVIQIAQPSLAHVLALSPRLALQSLFASQRDASLKAFCQDDGALLVTAPAFVQPQRGCVRADRPVVVPLGD
jgi:hypothetical protein